MKHYHMRTRDGERVAWVSGGGRLRRLTDERPGRQTVEWIALAVLSDAVGAPAAYRLGPRYAAEVGAMGGRWDLTERAVCEWAAAAEGGGMPGADPGARR